MLKIRPFQLTRSNDLKFYLQRNHRFHLKPVFNEPQKKKSLIFFATFFSLIHFWKQQKTIIHVQLQPHICIISISLYIYFFHSPFFPIFLITFFLVQLPLLFHLHFFFSLHFIPYLYFHFFFFHLFILLIPQFLFHLTNTFDVNIFWQTLLISFISLFTIINHFYSYI